MCVSGLTGQRLILPGTKESIRAASARLIQAGVFALQRYPAPNHQGLKHVNSRYLRTPADHQ